MVKTFQKRALAILGTLAIISGYLSTNAAVAAQPPDGYPSQEIMATASHETFGNIPIRRGFWDSDTDKGWGLDKAWNKHNIWSIEAMRKVLISPNYTKQGNGNYNLKAYAGKYKCSGSSCTLTDQREILGIYNPREYSVYYNWPVNGVMGMQTMYCNQNGVWKCPNWVTFSITHPGENNPYSVRSVEPSPSRLTKSERQDQQNKIDEPDSQRLLKDLKDGSVALDFSYTHLEKTIPNPR